MTSPMETYWKAARAFRVSDLRTGMADISHSHHSKADMQRMLTPREHAAYAADLLQAVQADNQGPSPEDQLSATGKQYWDEAQSLAREIISMQRRTTDPRTGEKTHSSEQKLRRAQLIDRAGELLAYFSSEVDEPTKQLFRDNHMAYSRYQSFLELEHELPVLKTRKEASPYAPSSVETFVQTNALNSALNSLEREKMEIAVAFKPQQSMRAATIDKLRRKALGK